MNREVLLERHENYQKQTYRNRCYIYGANGLQALVIPVLKQTHKGILDIRIDYKKKWQKIHWKSIESAYRLSPYFEYFAEDIAALYQKHVELLFEWNLLLLRIILTALDITTNIGFTKSFRASDDDPEDLRYSIHPKKHSNKQDPSFKVIPYQQVFITKFGFIPNLSIIDLIFNEGPHARTVLKGSVTSG